PLRARPCTRPPRPPGGAGPTASQGPASPRGSGTRRSSEARGEGGRDGPDDVARDEPLLTPVGRGQVSGEAVEVAARLKGGEGIEASREEGADHPGQHVAAAARGHAGIAGRIDEDASIRAAEHAARALEDEMHAIPDARLAHDLDAVGL